MKQGDFPISLTEDAELSVQDFANILKITPDELQNLEKGKLIPSRDLIVEFYEYSFLKQSLLNICNLWDTSKLPVLQLFKLYTESLF